MSKQPAGRPRKESDRQVRDALLTAAIALFSEQGFDKVGIRHIAAKAGVSFGLIRHYFGTKDALIAATTELVLTELKKAYTEILDDIDVSDGQAYIDQLLERAITLLSPNLDLLFYLSRLASLDTDDAHNAFRTYFQIIRQDIDRLEAAGKLRVDANKVWLTFQIIFAQLGPVFLAGPIEAIIGRPAHDPDVLVARNRELASVFKFGFLAKEG
ncbi:TetR/AcrR family transcriptional regulator [Exilibacterium tricleocarpae]|uniref:TetR/AcrR family transcriptional regulator n=1 Tax=Exilibacterium tricleocarpae TaxID=2591008 RepID=A0A545TV44_9GAMM|nr:TetR/AcrR family transcriptional regulator [Exilibacterium tricleocarpae]TQV81031.1 TetR/AcrR family transcriptional regulator [Exilibacterium tricleocarpae]